MTTFTRREMANFIEYLISDFDQSAESINCGDCEKFAHCLNEEIGGAGTVLWNDEIDGQDDPFHAFLFYEGYYYDSECPNGTDDWKDLPCIRRAMGLYSL